MTTSPEEIKALSTAHFVDWLKRYAGSLRYGDPPTNGNDIAFLEVARRLSEMDAENKRLREALQYVDDCFNAAMFEGWIDAKENGDVERIRDLWQRRISYAWSNTLNVLQDRAALEHQQQKGEKL